KLPGNELEIWLTEYNTQDDESPYTGSWIHGLAVAAMTLKYLETPEITKIINHTMMSNGVFGNTFESNCDFTGFACHCKLPPLYCTGNYATRQGEFTAVGNALNQIALSLKNSKSATRLNFTRANGSVPAILNGTASEYPSAYGWLIDDINTGEKEIVILNLHLVNSYNISFNSNSILGNGVDFQQDVLTSSDPVAAILGTAQTQSHSNYELTLTSAQNATSNTTVVTVPPLSLSRIFIPRPIVAHLTDNEICTGSSTTLIIEGGHENATFSVASTGNSSPQPLDIGVGAGNETTRHWQIDAGSTPATHTINVTCTNCSPSFSTTLNLIVHGDISDLEIKSGGVVVNSPVQICGPGSGPDKELTVSFTEGSGGSGNTPNLSDYHIIWTPDTGIVSSSCQSNSPLQLCDQIFVHPDRTTTYTAYVTDDQCWKSVSIVVEVPIAELDLGDDLLLCSNSDIIELKPILSTNSTNLSYQWSSPGPATSIWNYQVQGPGSQQVSLTVTENTSGCIATDEININVVACCSTGSGTVANLYPTQHVNPGNDLNEYYSSGENLLTNLQSICAACTTITYAVNNPANITRVVFDGSNATGQVTLQINGELRLDNDHTDVNGTLIEDGFEVTLKNVEILFSEKAFLRVKGGRTLQLEDCILDVCNAMMWDGIQVYGEATDNLPGVVLKNCTLTNAS
ncbi:MAG TPA: hypothetical protein PKC38_08440, partial [Chitinophagales bacterium]|nr:hypothetical protein [Chitinophagales bacterium]